MYMAIVRCWYILWVICIHTNAFYLVHNTARTRTKQPHGGGGGVVSEQLSPCSASLLNAGGKDFIADQLTSNDISNMRFVPMLTKEHVSRVSPLETNELNFDKFADIFRHAAPYIAMHRDTIMVIHISGKVLRDRAVFDTVMNDISILHLLGVKLVLVAGVGEQLNQRMRDAGYSTMFRYGMRITDATALRILKEESGIARYEIESALASGFRGMTGLSAINVVSGNFFYSAKPLGVRNGVDFKYTGEVRKIKVENFQKRLADNDIVLLTSLGYTTTSRMVYSVPSESLAAECALKLKAAKVIYLTAEGGLVDRRSGKQVPSLRLSKAIALLDKLGLPPQQYNYVESHPEEFNTEKNSGAISGDEAQNDDDNDEDENGFDDVEEEEQEEEEEGDVGSYAGSAAASNSGGLLVDHRRDSICNTDSSMGYPFLPNSEINSDSINAAQHGSSSRNMTEIGDDSSEIPVAAIVESAAETHSDSTSTDTAPVHSNAHSTTTSSSSSSIGSSGGTDAWMEDKDKEKVASFVRLIARCVYALTGGVRRAHILRPGDGAMLKELFTRDGSGTLISRDMYEGMRRATEDDLPPILDIIRPLEDEGILAPRSNEDIIRDIPNIFLMTVDGAVVAMGMLKRYGETHAEVACLAVHPNYRRGGRGETLLAYLERRALLEGVTHMFLLSTRTMQWFEERGFILGDPDKDLPPNRGYNKSRNSKVYIKPLGTQRDVDVEELMWDIA